MYVTKYVCTVLYSMYNTKSCCNLRADRIFVNNLDWIQYLQ